MILKKYTGFGGHDVTINNLSLGLEKLGYNVVIGSFSFVSDPPDTLKKIKLKKLSKFSSDFKGNRFDLVHNHQTLLNYYSLLSNLPFLFHYHGTTTELQEMNLHVSLSLCKNHIKKIISVSNTALKKMGDIHGIPSEVIYNGVDTDFYNTTIKPTQKKGDPQLLFVGKLYSHKNVMKILAQMKDILKQFPSAHLQIVGNGEEYNKLKKEIDKKGLEKHVELVGKLNKNKLKDYYASCDLYVSLSKLEAFPIPPLEAMSCGKPVVLSDIDPHKEIVSSSKAGLTFSLNHSSDLVKKIQKVYEKRKFFGNAGRRFAEQNDWKIVCKKVANVYEEIMS